MIPLPFDFEPPRLRPPDVFLADDDEPRDPDDELLDLEVEREPLPAFFEPPDFDEPDLDELDLDEPDLAELDLDAPDLDELDFDEPPVFDDAERADPPDFDELADLAFEAPPDLEAEPELPLLEAALPVAFLDAPDDELDFLEELELDPDFFDEPADALFVDLPDEELDFAPVDFADPDFELDDFFVAAISIFLRLMNLGLKKT